jgi:hypothetical protein
MILQVNIWNNKRVTSCHQSDRTEKFERLKHKKIFTKWVGVPQKAKPLKQSEVTL